MGRVVAIGAAAALVLVLTACGERSEPTGPGATLYPVTVTSPGGNKPLVLRRPARKIAVIAPSIQGVLVDLGAGRQIAGMPVAQNGTIRIADLRALRPDLLVPSSATDGRIVARAARAVRGTPVYVAPDDSIAGVEQTITQLGLITGRPGDAVRLVREIEARRKFVRKHLAGAPGVSAFVDTGFFTTVSNQSLVGDLLREAHATNVAGDSAQVGPFDLQELARLDPRWYVATSDGGTTLTQLRRNPLTRKLGAVRAGRFVIVDTGLIAPGPAIGQGLVDLAHSLHPDAFR
jgi:ABC-type Fe3+-hydroxamate transport system substrate-binding protein